MTVTFNTNLQARLTEQANASTKAIISGKSCKGANFWLTTPPSTFSDSVIESRSFQACLKMHLGLPLTENEVHCPDCNKKMDVYGHHALSCRSASGKISQHNSIVEGLHRFILKHNINCTREAFNPANDSRQRPGDFYIPAFDERGFDTYFDVSVIHILTEKLMMTS